MYNFEPTTKTWDASFGADVPSAPSIAATNAHGGARVRADGKFLRCGASKWYVKGLTYGPFSPDEHGLFLPARSRVRADFAQIHALGGNAIRVYHTPPPWLLDEAWQAGLRVMIDVPWEKHRCFLEDDAAQREARQRVGAAAALGAHPATFAISIANEIPKDIVRFYGERRIERFLLELLDVARQRAPECLLTYTNYPSTEFLRPWPIDFFSFNLYLEDPAQLGAYLDRLQHLAGTAPLVLGEHGLDSLRGGATRQKQAIAEQVRRVFDHGLAGSFVFSYTDDWFAGGAQVEDWAFGVTDRRRSEKPAAAALRCAWAQAPFEPDDSLPSVSIVVCSYNGAATLEECLQSLGRLNYPKYEMILVDDGSTDGTESIAARFPQVRYIRQENRGLSAARNIGAHHAGGQIVAYTDSDCVVDENWLQYLVREMRRQQVQVIGGPNIPPPSDCNIARCVAASPGGPSHVMIDDRLAEHVPGCNMAFRRETLLKLGGFDEQFRQAGDDVDICWRFLDRGYKIGYAASAVVWHHRRSTVRAYLKQQAGYGRAEAMLYFKHPARFNAFGSSLWSGVIYGESALGPAQLPPVIYHGRFGSELFPAIYRQNRVGAIAFLTLLEWHALAACIALLALVYPPLAWVSAAMWLMTFAAAVRAGWKAALSTGSTGTHWWSRPLVGVLQLAQPVVRSWHRYKYRLMQCRLPQAPLAMATTLPRPKPFGRDGFDLYWTSEDGFGRELLLDRTVQAAQELGWRGDFHCPWESHDLLLLADNWHAIEIRTATEELGGGKRFTRARIRLRPTGLTSLLALAAGAGSIVVCWQGDAWALLLSAALCGLLAARLVLSRHRCSRAVIALMRSAATQASLEPVDVTHASAPPPVRGASDDRSDAPTIQNEAGFVATESLLAEKEREELRAVAV